MHGLVDLKHRFFRLITFFERRTFPNSHHHGGRPDNTRGRVPELGDACSTAHTADGHIVSTRTRSTIVHRHHSRARVVLNRALTIPLCLSALRSEILSTFHRVFNRRRHDVLHGLKSPVLINWSCIPTKCLSIHV